MSYIRLDDVARPGFSKTARSCPRHRKARWDGDDRSAFPIAGWRLADDLTEDSAEGAQTAETHVQADVGHAPVGRSQQEHGPFDPPALKVPVRRLAKGRAKGSDEMSLRDARDSGEARAVETLSIGTVT